MYIRYRPSAEQFPIVVSQDCGHAETARAIKQYGDTIIHILVSASVRYYCKLV